MRKIYILALALIAGISSLKAADGMLPGRFTINAEGDTVHFTQSNLIEYNDTLYMIPFQLASYNLGLGFFPVSFANEPLGKIFYFNETDETPQHMLPSGAARVLTKDEWEYLFFHRPNAQKLFAYAKVTDNYIEGEQSVGVILLPDNWVLPAGLKFKPSTENYLEYDDSNHRYVNMNLDMNTNFEDNKYTLDQWEQMEQAGAVFLPAMGYVMQEELSYLNKEGVYATSTPAGEGKTYALIFEQKELYFAKLTDGSREISVRGVMNKVPGQGVEKVPSDQVPSTKVLRNGMLLIERNGKTYNAQGAEVK